MAEEEKASLFKSAKEFDEAVKAETDKALAGLSQELRDSLKESADKITFRISGDTFFSAKVSDALYRASGMLVVLGRSMGMPLGITLEYMPALCVMASYLNSGLDDIVIPDGVPEKL